MLGVFLVAGLYPFNFVPNNEVRWRVAENGVIFEGYGQVYGPGPFSSSGSPTPVAFSIELLISSHEGSKRSIESLFSIQNAYANHFAIERWTEDLVVAGWLRDARGRIFFDRLFCGHIFATEAMRFVTVTTSPEGTSVYVEGVQQRRYPGLELAPENFQGTLLLGQSSSGHQQWRGEIDGLAIYNGILTPEEVVENRHWWETGQFDRLRTRAVETMIYAFNERAGVVVHNHGNWGQDLEIPKKLHALHQVVLKVPNGRRFANLSDIALNVLGFIPFCALLVIYLHGGGNYSKASAAAMSILIGIAISLSIELLQVYLPSRDSSLLDLIMNALGSVVGAMVGLTLSPHVIRNNAAVRNLH